MDKKEIDLASIFPMLSLNLIMNIISVTCIVKICKNFLFVQLCFVNFKITCIAVAVNC